jgi:hypothetical protein
LSPALSVIERHATNGTAKLAAFSSARCCAFTLEGATMFQVREAPSVLERVSSWSSPVANASDTVLSGFFIDLGGPEAFPDPPVDLTTERARRPALVDRAVALGLMPPDDPLRKQLGAAAPPTVQHPALPDAPMPSQVK